jgi:hypothetical protein
VTNYGKNNREMEQLLLLLEIEIKMIEGAEHGDC